MPKTLKGDELDKDDKLDKSSPRVDRLSQKLRGLSFSEGEQELKPENQKNTVPPNPQEERERRMEGNALQSRLSSFRQELAQVLVARDPEARAEMLANAVKRSRLPSDFQKAVERVVNQVARMGPLKGTSGERVAFKRKQRSLQWTMDNVGLGTERSMGKSNKLKQLGHNAKGLFSGEFSRRRTEKRDQKLEGYNQKCIESIKPLAIPLLQQYQLLCFQVLGNTGIDISVPDFVQAIHDALGSLRVESKMDERQIDHGGEAESLEDEMQNARRLY